MLGGSIAPSNILTPRCSPPGSETGTEAVDPFPSDIVATSAERLCDELRAHGASANPFVGDLSKQQTAQALMAYAKAQYGRIDVLVNIVGGTIWFQPFQYYTPEQIEAEVNKSFWPSLWLCWSMLSFMIEQRSGAIVNLATHAVASRYRVPYAASTGGLIALTTSLAKEVAQHGIRIHCVAPHSTDAPDRVTPRTYSVQIPSTELPEEERTAEATFWRELVAREIPLGRRGRAAEQAAAIALLASEDASFITGQILPVGGGATYPF
jgi:dihydroxycyclohexadiene carboxylate dehydrogenase